MTDRVTVGNLRVARVLHDFINDEALPGTGVDPDSFWAGADKVVTDLAPKNQNLLARRDDLQAQTCSPNPRTSRSPLLGSTPRSPRPPALSWWCRFSTPASR
jgi:hypothetical protein